MEAATMDLKSHKLYYVVVVYLVANEQRYLESSGNKHLFYTLQGVFWNYTQQRQRKRYKERMNEKDESINSDRESDVKREKQR